MPKGVKWLWSGDNNNNNNFKGQESSTLVLEHADSIKLLLQRNSKDSYKINQQSSNLRISRTFGSANIEDFRIPSISLHHFVLDEFQPVSGFAWSINGSAIILTTTPANNDSNAGSASITMNFCSVSLGSEVRAQCIQWICRQTKKKKLGFILVNERAIISVKVEVTYRQDIYPEQVVLVSCWWWW